MAMNRREFAGLASRMAGALALGTACQAGSPQARDGRMNARPRRVATTASGTSRLNLGSGRDATLQMPAKSDAGALPLLVLLHGAGGSGDGILRRLGSFAAEAGIVVLSPDARGSTWDAIRGEFGADVEFIDRCLARVFAQVNIDPRRVSIGGFSDGATYALSLGLVNGDLFERIVAWSPGFVVGGNVTGKPKIYVSHGHEDEILPIDRCSRRIVPALKRNGYEVTYREFAGGHTVPEAIAREGMAFAAS
jgi:phospholipase/carboxylesterase